MALSILKIVETKVEVANLPIFLLEHLSLIIIRKMICLTRLDDDYEDFDREVAGEGFSDKDSEGT